MWGGGGKRHQKSRQIRKKDEERRANNMTKDKCKDRKEKLLPHTSRHLSPLIEAFVETAPP